MLRNTQFIGCGFAAVIRYWLWVVGLEQMARRNRRPGVEWMMAPALKAAGREAESRLPPVLTPAGVGRWVAARDKQWAEKIFEQPTSPKATKAGEAREDREEDQSNVAAF